MRNLAVVLFAFCLVIPAGCKGTSQTPDGPTLGQDINVYIAKNKTSILTVVKLAAEVGTERGLKEWAKKNPAAAAEAAVALNKNINDVLYPYFKDAGKMMTAEEVQELLDSSLFNNVPDVVKVAVIAASAVLDFYLPIPDSGTYLTQDQKDIIAAFLDGVQEGCKDFSSPGTKAVKVAKDKTERDAQRVIVGHRWIGSGKPAKVVPVK